MNRQSSDLSWINEIDKLLEAQSSSIILHNNNFNIDQNEKGIHSHKIDFHKIILLLL